MKKVISIDGGGVRGVIASHILEVLENKLQDDLYKYVDLVAGTSTGSIIGAGIADGVPMSDVVDFYYSDAKKIFDKKDIKQKFKSLFGLIGGRYDVDDLVESLENRYSSKKLKDLKTDFICPTFNMTKGETTFLSKRYNPNMKLSEAVAASSSAPTYLGPIQTDKGDLADGGLFASSPSMCAFAEIKDMNKNLLAKDIFMFSVGTGNRLRGYKNSYKWFKTKWIKILIDIMMSTDSPVAHYQLKRIYESINKKENYVRVNGILPDYIDRDIANASDKNLNNLYSFSKQLVKAHNKYLDHTVETLKYK